MAETEAGETGVSGNGLASVAEAVRIATEASLATPVSLAASDRAAQSRRDSLMRQPSRNLAGRQAGSSAVVEAPVAGVPLALPASEPSIEGPTVRRVAPDAIAELYVPTPMSVILTPKMETVMTTAEDLMSFQQANFEALMKSGQIWAAGLQDLGRTWAASAQAQMDETMGTVKAMTSVKSLREAVELQSTLARSSMEKVVAEGGKLTDASMKLAEQTMAPITARLSIAAERFGRPAA